MFCHIMYHALLRVGGRMPWSGGKKIPVPQVGAATLAPSPLFTVELDRPVLMFSPSLLLSPPHHFSKQRADDMG